MAWTSAKSAADRDEMIRWLFENSRDLMHVIGPDPVAREPWMNDLLKTFDHGH